MTRAMPRPVAASAALVLALTGIRAGATPRSSVPAAHVEAQSLHVDPRAILPPLSRDAYAVTPGYAWPVDVLDITDPYGPRPAGAPCAGCLAVHMGLDFGGGGHPMYAIAAGRVIEVGGPDAGYGNYAILEHEVGGLRFQSLYAHMAPGSRLVGVGDVVGVRQPLGIIGSTGNATGPHLHLEVLVEGRQVDPLAFLEARVR